MEILLANGEGKYIQKCIEVQLEEKRSYPTTPIGDRLMFSLTAWDFPSDQYELSYDMRYSVECLVVGYNSFKIENQYYIELPNGGRKWASISECYTPQLPSLKERPSVFDKHPNT